MALSSEQKEKLDALLDEGKPPKEIAGEMGISITTVYNYKKQEHADPAGTAPPNVETTGTGTRKKIVKRSKPITEETAGQLCAGIFSIAAMMDGPEWFLSPEERDALGAPLADSLRILPAPIAEGVNLYSAPVMFVTTLSTIMYAKGKRRAMRGQRPAPHLRPVPPQAQTSAPGPTPPQPKSTESASPSTAANMNAKVDISPEVLAAANAAKGGLRGIDESDEATAHFGSGE
jgi:hypothetical protein